MAGGNVPAQYAPVFQQAAAQNHIPASVLAGIASVESNMGQNQGPSSAGAVGWMQFLPSTARGLGINPMDPRQAIFGAAKLLNQYGYQQNPTRAIAAYNAGPGNYQAGLGYAQQVVREAGRLSSQLNGGAPGAAGGFLPSGSANPASGGNLTIQVPYQTTSFDQAGYNSDRAKFVAGSAIKAAGNQFDSLPGASKGFGASLGSDTGALFQKGLLTTGAPNPQNYVSTQTRTRTMTVAQDAVQQLAGGPLNIHPDARGATIAGGFLPKGAMYVARRQDQGRDGQTNPGGPIVANGNGRVVAVLSDPSGFGPSYPVVRFTSGPYAGKTLYFGHTLSVVKPGQQVQAGQVISHTGTSGVGNATVPGWFEIGFAPGGVPGKFGQPAPF